MRCTIIKVEKLKTETKNIDRLSITTDDGLTYICFMPYSEALMFLNEEVTFEVRNDIIDGVKVQILTDVARYKTINVLSKENNIKLYSEEYGQTKCTADFRFISDREISYGVVVYCTSSEFKSNSTSSWQLLSILDKNGITAKTYLFSPLEKGVDFNNCYLTLDLIKTKFGFKTEEVIAYTPEELGINPEISIAVKYIEDIVNPDNDLKEFMKSTSFIEALTKYAVEDEIERGYIAVELAHTLYIGIELLNLTPILDRTLLIRGIILSKSFVLTNKPETPRSLSLQNILICSKHPKLAQDSRLLNILDVEPQREVVERQIIKNVNLLAKDMIKYRRRLDESILSSNKIWTGGKK